MRTTPSITHINWSGTTPNLVQPNNEGVAFNSTSYSTYLSNSTIIKADAEL